MIIKRYSIQFRLVIIALVFILAITLRIMKSCGIDVGENTFMSKNSSFCVKVPSDWMKYNGKEEFEDDLLLTYANPTRKGKVIRVDSRAVIGFSELEVCTEEIVESYMHTYMLNMENQIVEGMEKENIKKEAINENDTLYSTNFKGTVQGEKLIYKLAVLNSKERFFHILAYDNEETFSKVENDIDEMMKSLVVLNKK